MRLIQELGVMPIGSVVKLVAGHNSVVLYSLRVAVVEPTLARYYKSKRIYLLGVPP